MQIKTRIGLAACWFALSTMPTVAMAEDGEKSYSLSWALVMLSIVFGLMICLRPTKRTSEFKKPVED